MSLPQRKLVEETLIRDVLGWPVIGEGEEAGEFPAACWSPGDGCFRVTRAPDRPPERFSPARSFHDVWEVRQALHERFVATELSRPLNDGNVRVVADVGSKEVVVEGRSLPWSLAVAIYEAQRDGLLT